MLTHGVVQLVSSLIIDDNDDVCTNVCYYKGWARTCWGLVIVHRHAPSCGLAIGPRQSNWILVHSGNWIAVHIRNWITVHSGNWIVEHSENWHFLKLTVVVTLSKKCFTFEATERFLSKKVCKHHINMLFPHCTTLVICCVHSGNHITKASKHIVSWYSHSHC